MMNELIRLFKVIILIFCLVLVLAGATLMLRYNPKAFETVTIAEPEKPKLWEAPDIKTLSKDKEDERILYGRELISHTSDYLGPNGSVMKISNGMNCQNCHLEAGTKPFGNNFGSVASTYPKFRARSGGFESIEKRVNDCLERSLNGNATLDSLSKEMVGIVSYIKWLGKDVSKESKAAGSGFVEMVWLNRPADPAAGKKLYMMKCQICHGNSGEGQRISANSRFIYPPLWGENSFTTAAGLFRISNFSKYIVANMPNGATYDSPLLKEEEAWDIAAFVLTMPRPDKKFSQDWPKIETKPVDHPFGPYADNFSEQQHKFGPFKEILEMKNEK
ncbi:MAG: c-type cytochrome [Cyclobacteriaceae bacterium]|nr:c-type cytochrome [Cyclobacteriaceae bacterium]